MANEYISNRRLYLNSKGEMVEEGDPDKATLLVAKGGKLSAEDAAKYGLTGLREAPEPEEKAIVGPALTKAVAKAPSNKKAPAPSETSQEAPDATEAAQELADEKGIDLSEVEGSGEGGRILKSDVEKAAGE